MLPDFLTTVVSSRSGETITLRPMRADDSARFGEYVCGLSEATRSFYGPHPFTQETAEAICATLDPNDILRFVATIPRADDERIIAYFLLKQGVLKDDVERYEKRLPLDPATDATLAPSVADDWQEQGLGSRMMQHVLQAAAKLGKKRVVLWGGVQERNERAVHFYSKYGFRKVGEFTSNHSTYTLNNHDMILDLDAVPGNEAEEAATR